jgi:hypothetical protein
MSRLTIDITDQLHQSLKALSALQGKTIKQYALERLFPGDADGDLPWQELKTLLGARIDEGLAGKVSVRWRRVTRLLGLPDKCFAEAAERKSFNPRPGSWVGDVNEAFGHLAERIEPLAD